MATASRAQAQSEPAAAAGWPAATPAFELTVVALGAWMMLGVYLDGWAHQHFRIETFFTPWHAVLYSGMLAVTAFLVVAAVGNRLGGRRWTRSLPRGYGLSLAAVLLFGVGGLLDLAWHSALGFERRFEALVSPPHLLLAACGMVAAAGPLRAAWLRPGQLAPWPAVIAAFYVLSTITFFSQFAHPFNEPFALSTGPVGTAYAAQALGLLSIVFQASVLVAVLLLLLRRFALPRGAVLFIVALNGFAVGGMKDHYWALPVAVAGGLAGELLLATLRPSTSRPTQLRVFGFALPVALYAAYFAAITALGGTWWPTPVWAGSIVLAGALGLLVSYAMVPPPSGP